MEEIFASRVIVADDPDGPRVVIEPGTIRLEGSDRGWVILGFDQDSEAGMALVSKDGKCKTSLRGASDAAGLSIKRGSQEATLCANGVCLGDRQSVSLTDAGLIVKDPAGATVLEVPFSVNGLKAFARELVESVSKAKGWLASKLKVA